MRRYACINVRRSFNITSCAGRGETVVSRNPSRSKRPQQTNPGAANDGNPADDAIIEQAHALYGSEAATAVAFCGLDAWFDGEEEEFRRLAGLFRRLRN
jgi:hypothetical protein